VKLNRNLTGSSLAAITLSVTAVLAAPVTPASASASAGTASIQTSNTAVSKLAAELGSSSAGIYLDSNGRTTVDVTTTAAAKKVRAAGAVARLVTRSAAVLNSATSTLSATAKVPGTAWAVDPASNQVLVSVDSSVTGARLA
jgi:streptogrisin D